MEAVTRYLGEREHDLCCQYRSHVKSPKYVTCVRVRSNFRESLHQSVMSPAGKEYAIFCGVIQCEFSPVMLTSARDISKSMGILTPALDFGACPACVSCNLLLPLVVRVEHACADLNMFATGVGYTLTAGVALT